MGANNWLPLFHMDKSFIWPEKKSINDFKIGYMINPKLNINKSLIEQVNKSTKTTFGATTNLILKPQ